WARRGGSLWTYCCDSRPRCSMVSSGRNLHSERIGLWRFSGFPVARALERDQRLRTVDVDDSVELIGQPTLEVVTHSLGLRQVDHPDGALQQRASEYDSDLRIMERKQEGRNSRLV